MGTASDALDDTGRLITGETRVVPLLVLPGVVVPASKQAALGALAHARIRRANGNLVPGRLGQFNLANFYTAWCRECDRWRRQGHGHTCSSEGLSSFLECGNDTSHGCLREGLFLV